MTDLEINVNLARAMGWDEDDISSSFYKQNLEAYDFDKGHWRPFDYRDPVIFVAICKRWELDCYFSKDLKTVRHTKSLPMGAFFDDDSIEKAAALCVIDAVKRGMK